MKADYIIIGGGSAGCVLAARLSEDPAVSVILLEAGGEDRNPLIHVPAGYIKTMVNPAMNWMFETEPHEASNNRRIKQPRGKVLGGSSSINAMLYVRGQAADYDGWAQRGNLGWSFRDVLPYFRRAEHCEFSRDDDEFHAKGGPLNVSGLRNGYEALDLLIEAAKSCGYRHNPDYNGASQDGFGYYQVTQKNGMRFSAKKAYLEDARKRPNLRVITHAHVTGLTLEGEAGGTQCATGVTFRRRGSEQAIHTGREVILSAGAIQSPQILELSGIGHPDLLASHGIAVRHALAGVGENFHDHYISRLSWRLRATSRSTSWPTGSVWSAR